jgi:hypothetical protein
MKKKLIPYMSYWSSGYKGEPNDLVINLHKLSSYFLLKNFGEVHFITDTKGLKVFQNLPWTSVSTDLDKVDVTYRDTWSISKLFAYKLISEKGKPFIHVDYDVLLPNGIDRKLLKSKLFAQSTENSVYFFYEIDNLKKYCPNLHEIKNYEVKDGYNVGIIGGSDVEFFSDYANSALSFITDEQNRNFWLNYTGHNSWVKSVIAEQYYLAVMAKKHKKKFNFVFPNGWPTEEEAKEKSYIHLMGAKNNYDVDLKIEKLVKKLGL